MTRNPIWVALFAAILAACGSVPANTGATSSEDAATNNPETAVANDVPSPPPDAPVVITPEDAGNPADAQDAQVVADTSPEDAGAMLMPDSGMMTADLSAETCTRINQRCWGLPGQPCQRIVCRVRDGRRWLTLPPNVSVLVGPEARCHSSPSGEGICEGQEVDGTPTNAILRGLNPTMDQAICTRPGQADVVIEGRSS